MREVWIGMIYERERGNNNPFQKNTGLLIRTPNSPSCTPGKRDFGEKVEKGVKEFARKGFPHSLVDRPKGGFFPHKFVLKRGVDLGFNPWFFS